MAETRTLNLLKELKGRPVLNSGTGQQVGIVEDGWIQPTQGRLLGLILKDNEGQLRSLGVQEFLIGRDAVMTGSQVHFETAAQSTALREGVSAQQLKGVSVVTGDGRLLGRISDIHVDVEQPRIAYHITESTLQRFFGGGYYLPGHAARTFAPDGSRLIVPDDADTRLAATTLEEAFAAPGATA
jgi:sporulation protein YlmC with PRC-barrel domain